MIDPIVVDAPPPFPDPISVVDGYRTAWAGGLYAFAVVLVLLAVARGLYAAAVRYPDNAIVRGLNLHSAAVRGVITSAVSVLTALSVELTTMAGVDWRVIGGALAASLALLLRPEPKGAAPDLPKPPAAPASGY
jgi:hypothetical protein